MALTQLDHVNIRTTRLAELTGFYAEVLGLRPGPRPPFGFSGAWLYCGTQAAVHLVGVAQGPQGNEPKIEHFAFRAEGLAAFLARLRRGGISYRISIVPQLELRQINIFDPDGNHIEVAFGAEENADLTDYPGPSA